MQQSIFNNDPVSILSVNGEAILYPGLFSKTESDQYFDRLVFEINWKQEPIKIFGKEVMQPRLTAWYGDTDKPYRYSGVTMQPEAWTETLNNIRQKIEAIAGVHFTSALLNRYRDGQDSMGWHRDNEKELGRQPVIGSVSFGATRKFHFRNYQSKLDKRVIDLSHGSFLLMRGDTNHYWEHQVPKTAAAIGERINLTFRIIH